MRKIYLLLGWICWRLAVKFGPCLLHPKWKARQQFFDARAGVGRDEFSGFTFIPEVPRPGLHISERDRWRLGIFAD